MNIVREGKKTTKKNTTKRKPLNAPLKKTKKYLYTENLQTHSGWGVKPWHQEELHLQISSHMMLLFVVMVIYGRLRIKSKIHWKEQRGLKRTSPLLERHFCLLWIGFSLRVEMVKDASLMRILSPKWQKWWRPDLAMQVIVSAQSGQERGSIHGLPINPSKSCI